MKKSLSLIVCSVLLLAVVTAPAHSQTTKDVLAKFIEAQGGAKALAAIKDTTISGNMELVSMGMSATLTMYQKEPNKMRMDIEVMGMVITQAYDGEIGWMVNPQTGATEQLPENMTQEFKRQALGNEALLNPEKFGIKYDFTGKEKIDDKEYLVLTQTTAEGHVTTMYIDPATYLTYKTKGKTIGQSGEEVMAESVVGDYKKVDGVLMAHSMTTYQDGQEFMRMTITKVAFNAGLEDSLFQMAK
jgi:outer membrane lipoprotein-sorting protein